ncbi:hypothetical protein MYX78_03980 [Acidobacteria bacterium AH-259-G07]|nr:hypothetical protein [Acidobacteria bacterium AH-259-G07]
MNDALSIILLYATAVLVVVGGCLFYLQFSSLRWDESEIRLLEHLELHLAHVLRLIDAPDVRLLLREPESRQRLFLDFSSYLREDVMALLRSRKLDPVSLIFAGAFFLSYFVMRLKARLLCSRNDLRFLSGLELALFRRLEKIELG